MPLQGTGRLYKISNNVRVIKLRGVARGVLGHLERAAINLDIGSSRGSGFSREERG